MNMVSDFGKFSKKKGARGCYLKHNFRPNYLSIQVISEGWRVKLIIYEQRNRLLLVRNGFVCLLVDFQLDPYYFIPAEYNGAAVVYVPSYMEIMLNLAG